MPRDIELVGKLRIFIRYFALFFTLSAFVMIVWEIVNFQLKESFAVEEEGYDEVEGEEAENLMRDFVEYVKSNKVRVNLVSLFTPIVFPYDHYFIFKM